MKLEEMRRNLMRNMKQPGWEEATKEGNRYCVSVPAGTSTDGVEVTRLSGWGYEVKGDSIDSILLSLCKLYGYGEPA